MTNYQIFCVLFTMVSSTANGNVQITPECQKYCDSKRKYGTTEEFIADCGLKVSHGLGQCAGDCYEAKCPGHLCPKKYDINCPTGISLRPPPTEKPKSRGWKSPKVYGIMAAVIVIVLICCGVLSCLVRCHTLRRMRINRVQREDYENEAFPVILQVPSSQSASKGTARLVVVGDSD